MAYISEVSIANANRIETLHNQWCEKNGYPVKWIVTNGRRSNKEERKNEKQKTSNT